MEFIITVCQGAPQTVKYIRDIRFYNCKPLFFILHILQSKKEKEKGGYVRGEGISLTL